MNRRMPKRAALPTTRPRLVDARSRTAYHEAGHAVLSIAIANKPEQVSIRPNRESLGRAVARPSVRPSSRVQVHLAGYAAEHLLTRRRSPHYEPDLRFAIFARHDAALRAAFVGSADRDGTRVVEELLRMGLFIDDDELRCEVDRFYEIARESLSSVWRAVDGVAKALLKHEELDRDGIDEALGDCDVYAPVFAVQRLHGLLLHVASPQFLSQK
jgi:hypothetical protein